ncbi:glycosyltransferase family 2 protein [Siansivirga zeaxanthinifaciens]|uniref:Glycosyl transferase family 2 n=1 Tax=Siansivirga zeaxanthinifaciens CC-SAMT-1 TaxID=1454006 RepID=A0A0C5WJF1_9FLAO|nr:glycosyltransferase family 2 protein [Siansivirga zeaxanthinifaciens]AJR02870.1 glycosyl transferase family 2 [Siansivirga zeaxanthinifaciens CC-SAMT-1]
METNCLISIVVPVYNVEKYLRECLDSILNQSYKKLEILIVNDGSTDKSGQICDEFVLKDSRVKVFHNENCGVSFARNFGLNKVTGHYVVFVDSDDIILPNFVDYMLYLIKNTGAEFCMSKYVSSSKDVNVSDVKSYKVLTSEEATCILLYPEIPIGCWNKIFKVSLLRDNNIFFPTDFFMGEGLNFITMVSQMTDKVGLGYGKVYYYRTDNLDSATTNFNINKIGNAFEAIHNIRKKLILRTPKVKKALDFHLWWTNFYALQSIFKAKQIKKYKKEVNLYSSHLSSGAFTMLTAKVSLLMKLKIILLCISPLGVLKIQNHLRNFKKLIRK